MIIKASRRKIQLCFARSIPKFRVILIEKIKLFLINYLEKNDFKKHRVTSVAIFCLVSFSEPNISLINTTSVPLVL